MKEAEKKQKEDRLIRFLNLSFPNHLTLSPPQQQQQQQRFAEFDFLSAGMGALAVTSYCVWRGQDPLTALSITAAATVTAVVANELMLEAERKQQE